MRRLALLLILVMPLMGMSCSFLTDDQLQLYSSTQDELAVKVEALDASGALARYDAATDDLEVVIAAALDNPKLLSAQDAAVLEAMYGRAKQARLAVFVAVRAQPPNIEKAKQAGVYLMAMTVVLEVELATIAAKVGG